MGGHLAAPMLPSISHLPPTSLPLALFPPSPHHLSTPFLHMLYPFISLPLILPSLFLCLPYFSYCNIILCFPPLYSVPYSKIIILSEELSESLSYNFIRYSLVQRPLSLPFFCLSTHTMYVLSSLNKRPPT